MGDQVGLGKSLDWVLRAWFVSKTLTRVTEDYQVSIPACCTLNPELPV